MKTLLIIFTLFSTSLCRGQEEKYYCNIHVADSLYALGEFSQSATCFQSAFESNEGTAEPEDYFKLLRCLVLSGEPTKAFRYLDNLCKAEFFNYVLLQRDSILASLKNASPARWKELVDCLKKNKETFAPLQNLEWTNMLDNIFDQDQRIRRQYRKEVDNNGSGSEQAKSLFRQMRGMDSIHTTEITKFIDTHGWLGPAVVGEKGSTTLFLIVQHSDSATQEKYLPLLRAAVREKKARPQELALMEDRLSLAKYGYQLYGSQINQDSTTKAFYIQPIKDEVNVNKRRAGVGLEPLEEYVKQWNIEYKPKEILHN